MPRCSGTRDLFAPERFRTLHSVTADLRAQIPSA